MALKTKAIKKAREINDGLRISIMSRHTLNDGITPDSEITKTSFDEWWPELAPPERLIGSYYKRGLPWEEFEREFLCHLESPAIQTRLQRLVELSRSRNITVLCVEDAPQRCHRRLVAEACRKIDPSLEVIIE
jgi:uncharacterized protein YeaO (DUF488 family)